MPRGEQRGSRQLSGAFTGSNICFKLTMFFSSCRFQCRAEVCCFKRTTIYYYPKSGRGFGSRVGNFHENLNFTSICDGLAYQNWRKVHLMAALLQKGSV